MSESLIKETAEALISTGLADLGYKYVNLDDCWQAAERDATGRVQEDSERFPSGLKALGEFSVPPYWLLTNDDCKPLRNHMYTAIIFSISLPSFPPTR
ncbi:hypothetical protein EON65_28315 [archaeon]|nr:MAG: hypothetical protein EON65_28315 [archaeon]